MNLTSDPAASAPYLDRACCPLALMAIDQPLVDHLTVLVNYLGNLNAVPPEAIPEYIRDLYERAMRSIVQPEPVGAT